MAEYEAQEAVLVGRGFQFQNNWHFNHQIKCITQQTSDAVFVFYNVGSGNVASLCPYKQHKPCTKHSLPSNVSNLIYIRKFRLLVASCPDLTLRIYSEHFELIDTVHITATVLSLAFNEVTSELYTGGVGCINTWLLRHQLHNPLVLSKQFACSVDKQQWVISLDFDLCSEVLVATCQDAVYVINTHTHSQINCFINTHHGSLTYAVFFHLLEYVITAAKDGSIKVWNCILHSEVHTFTGHLKAVTGLKVHPTSPCVISCSLDGSIRTWHLENMTQCYYLECGEQLLGMCTDFPLGNRLACYSHHSLMMWHVNQVETHFASVNSHVVSMSRVEDISQCSKECTKARILALAEDGGVRLLSPVTGQVITILFPMSSSQLLSDVVYSLSDSLFFVLLKTSEVIVFNATTNPCSAHQLWVAPSNRQLLSIALCHVLLENGDTCCLVFGGEKSGHIALLFSSGDRLSMPHPCPAHDGHVTKLIASCDVIVPFCSDNPNLSTTTVQTALVSYGSDNMLNIWCLELKKTNQVTLKLQMSIHTELEPVLGKLFGSTLCLSFPDNRIVMMNTPRSQQQDNRIIATSHSLSKMSLLMHQTEDDHTDSVISLQCCPKLKLLATSSKDGHIKIWNEENHLLSEIDFGESLASVCFANLHGDLLVGFQKHISLIQARDYLPETIVEINSRDTLLEDYTEHPMTFDSDLEFWYDSGRIPCLPVEQDGRKQWKEQSDKDVDRQSTSGGQGSSATGLSVAEIRESAKSLQSKVDSCLAQKLSEQYAEELLAQPPAKLKHGTIRHGATGEKSTHSMMPTVSSLTAVSPSSTCLHQSASSGHLVCAAAARGKSGKKRRGSSRPQLPQRQMSVIRNVPPKAEVLPLQFPSAEFPIAPDGFIPNSILRSKFNYTPPVVILKPYQPPNVRLKMIQMEKNRNRANLSRSGSNDSSILTAVSGEQFMDYSESNHMIVTCVSQQLDSRQLDSEEGQKRQRQKSSYGGFLHPKSAEFGSSFDWNESQYSMSTSPSGFVSRNPSNFSEHRAYNMKENTSDVRFLNPDTCKENMHTLGTSGIDDTGKNAKQIARTNLTFDALSSQAKAKAEERKSDNGQRRQSQCYSGAGVSLGGGHPQGEATNAIRRKSCDHGHTGVRAKVHRASLPPNLSGSELDLKFSQEEMTKSSFKSGPKRSSSVYFQGAAAYRNSVNYGIVKLDSLHVVALQNIQNSSWFPKNRQTQLHGTSDELTEVVNTLISMQQNSALPVFNEICSALLQLNKGGALAKEQRMEIASELSRRLSSSSANSTPLRTAALGTLEKIGVGNKKIILRILPLLTDPNVEVCYAAFSALRAIAGVANRSQLHRLLVKLGLLQHVTTDEEELMSGLADRVDSGNVQLSPNSRILDVCKVGANFGQRFATRNISDYGSNTNPRDSFTTIYSGHPTSSKSKKKRRRTLSEKTDPSGYSSRQLDPLDSSSHVQRRTYPDCEKDGSSSRSAGGDFGKGRYRTNSLSMQGKGLFSHDCLPNPAAVKVAKSKIQELVLQCPTGYSQSRLAARMMLRAYGKDVPGKLEADEYEWSDVFHVTRKTSRSFLFVDSGKSVSCRLDPEIATKACFTVCEVHPSSRRLLKLPQINVEGAKACGTHRTYGHDQPQWANEPLRSINNDQESNSRTSRVTDLLQHSREGFDTTETERAGRCSQDNENTGLIIKLPEITNVRVAQSS